MLPSDYGSEYPDGYNISEPIYTLSSATFSAGFELPGSMIAYIVEVSNLGSIDGQVGIGNLSCGDNSAIICQAQAMDENSLKNGMISNGFEFLNGNQDYSEIDFLLKVGEKHYIVVMIGYDDVTEQPTDLDASIKLDLTYEQYKNPNISVPSGETTLIGGQDIDIVSSGDGLYEDEYESGRYVYKGADPNNYIAFGEETTIEVYVVTVDGEDEGFPPFYTLEECQDFIISGEECTLTSRQDYTGGLWRIISKEADETYKIINNAYLRDYGDNGAIGNSMVRNWAKPSELNKILNEQYLNSLDSSIKNKLVVHTWNIGTIIMDNDDLNSQIESEKSQTWLGTIGLVSHSDYLRANRNMKLCGTDKTTYENYISCRNSNWMFDGGSWWTISARTDNPNIVCAVDWDGQFNCNRDNSGELWMQVRPAVYLSSNITLMGSGTQSDPYKITN